MTAAEILAAAPRVSLGYWPTPLVRCDRLREVVGGPMVWLKRDDCSGLALGGNKTRKLEYHLGAALAAEATGVVTFGALQSNHARQTAAACNAAGLTCDLVLVEAVDRHDQAYVASGNLLLDGVLGATVHQVADEDAAAETLFALLGEAEADGRALHVVPPGASDVVGTLGYVQGALELWTQAGELALDVERVVVAASTAGTAAGLVVGAGLASAASPAAAAAVVDVACVYAPAVTTEATLATLVADTAAHLGLDDTALATWKVDDTPLGAGYGIPSEVGLAAIALLARTEGVLLDPVYTSKAFAHLLAAIDSAAIPADRDVVFVHTGGAPGLFAYPDEVAAR
ncbi:MAG: pyridoxal-phosphate dependent enzyme [Acidimicrobiia bacterium]|nr:pyridoxal-phosphate dependent enzyme [Acidimicrobiia bacterium]